MQPAQARTFLEAARLLQQGVDCQVSLVHDSGLSDLVKFLSSLYTSQSFEDLQKRKCRKGDDANFRNGLLCVQEGCADLALLLAQYVPDFHVCSRLEFSGLFCFPVQAQACC